MCPCVYSLHHSVCQESCLQTSTALLLTALPAAQHSHKIAITPWHVPGGLPSPGIPIRHKAIRSRWRFSLEPAQAFGLLSQCCKSKQKSAAAVTRPLPPLQRVHKCSRAFLFASITLNLGSVLSFFSLLHTSQQDEPARQISEMCFINFGCPGSQPGAEFPHS